MRTMLTVRPSLRGGRPKREPGRTTELTHGCLSASTLAEIGAALSLISLAVWQKDGDKIHINSFVLNRSSSS
jgi:hypothetical protein